MEPTITLTAKEAHRMALESREGADDCLIECLKQIREAAEYGRFQIEFKGFGNLAIKSLMVVSLQKAGFNIPDPHMQIKSPESGLLIKW